MIMISKMGKQLLQKKGIHDSNQVNCSGITIKVSDCSGWKIGEKGINLYKEISSCTFFSNLFSFR